MIGYRFLFLAAVVLVIGLYTIYPALDNARRIMEGIQL